MKTKNTWSDPHGGKGASESSALRKAGRSVPPGSALQPPRVQGGGISEAYEIHRNSRIWTFTRIRRPGMGCGGNSSQNTRPNPRLYPDFKLTGVSILKNGAFKDGPCTGHTG